MCPDVLRHVQLCHATQTPLFSTVQRLPFVNYSILSFSTAHSSAIRVISSLVSDKLVGMLQSSYYSDKSTLTGQADDEKRRIPMWGRLVGALLLMGVVGLALWNVADSGVVSSVSVHDEITVKGSCFCLLV